MNPDVIAALALGLVVGVALGFWRTWAFARKLIHLGVSLDEWAEYDERNRQAHGQSRRDNVTRMRLDSDR